MRSGRFGIALHRLHLVERGLHISLYGGGIERLRRGQNAGLRVSHYVVNAMNPVQHVGAELEMFIQPEVETAQPCRTERRVEEPVVRDTQSSQASDRTKVPPKSTTEFCIRVNVSVVKP